MGLKDRLKKLERDARKDTLSIPQPDGFEEARFAREDLAAAYLVATDRELGRITEDHPLCAAARRSPDPAWSQSVFAGPAVLPRRRTEDLSEE